MRPVVQYYVDKCTRAFAVCKHFLLSSNQSYVSLKKVIKLKMYKIHCYRTSKMKMVSFVSFIEGAEKNRTIHIKTL